MPLGDSRHEISNPVFFFWGGGGGGGEIKKITLICRLLNLSI